MFNPTSANIFDRPLWHNGPRPGAFYNFPQQQQLNHDGGVGVQEPLQRSAGPITTGSSVIGLKFDGGVIIAADTLVSYGSLARFRNIDRVFKVNEHTIIGCSGDYADFQFIKKHIDQKITDDYCHDDGIELQPRALFNWLTRVLYQRRSRFEPLWLDLVVGGMQDGLPFLGHVDVRGRAYEDSAIATGYGKHLAVPLLREETERARNRAGFGANGLVTQRVAQDLVRKSMEVLYYRDGRSDPQYKQAVSTSKGAEVVGPFQVSQNWELATLIKGYN